MVEMQSQQTEFRTKLDALVEATNVLSGSYLSHPLSKTILDYDGIKTIPWLLEYLRECKQNPADINTNPWVAFEAIHHFVGEDEYLPYIPEKARGKLDQLFDIYDAWGINRKMILPNL